MKRPLVSPTGKAVTIGPVHPNAGLQAAYRKKLDALIDEMNASLVYWLTVAYRTNEPEMAQDRSPAATINAVMKRLARRWQRRFNQLAPDLAAYFAKAAADRTDAGLRAALRKAGFTVEFKLSAGVQDALTASIAENVGLIRSIAQQHLTAVQGHVLRSVQQGRDLGGLAKALQAQHGVTKRRAAFISLDQSNKATAVITRARQKELGITEAIWQHSGGGKHPRPEHVAFSGKRYDIAKGAYLEGVWTFPGHEIRCRCVSRSVVPGFN